MFEKRASAEYEAIFTASCVPLPKVMESGPCLMATSMNFSAISRVAWSQEMRCHLPSPRLPTRFIG